jgi:hypothetical protein
MRESHTQKEGILGRALSQKTKSQKHDPHNPLPLKKPNNKNVALTLLFNFSSYTYQHIIYTNPIIE